jgi:hypothetical protein
MLYFSSCLLISSFISYHYEDSVHKISLGWISFSLWWQESKHIWSIVDQVTEPNASSIFAT